MEMGVEGDYETEAGVREQNAKKKEEEEGARDLENGQTDFEEKVIQRNVHNVDVPNDDQEFHPSKFQTLNPTNPLRIVINNATRVASLSPAQSQHSQPRSTSIPQQVCFL